MVHGRFCAVGRRVLRGLGILRGLVGRVGGIDRGWKRSRDENSVGGSVLEGDGGAEAVVVEGHGGVDRRRGDARANPNGVGLTGLQDIAMNIGIEGKREGRPALGRSKLFIASVGV